MRVFRWVVAIVALLVLAAVPARAQNARADDRALFGGGVGDVEQMLSATSTISASGVEVLEGSLRRNAPTLPDRTWLGQGVGQVLYALGIPHLRGSAALAGYSFYYPYRDQPWYRTYSARANESADYAWDLTRRTQFGVHQSADLEPAYRQSLLANNISLPGNTPETLFLPSDISTIRGQLFSVGAGASLRHHFSRRVSFSGTYGTEQTWSIARPSPYQLWRQTGSAGVDVGLTRHLTAHGAYRYTESRIGPPGSPRYRTNNLEGGIDYDRGGIQLSRHTTLSLAAGADAVADRRGRQHYAATGNATLDHELGRTWSSSIGYWRGFNFSSLLQEPILSDNVSANLSGLISSRVMFHASAVWSRGAVGFAGGDSRYLRELAVVGVQCALTRNVALGTAYSYYFRAAGSDVVLPEDIDARSRSQLVQAYVTAWVPLFRRARRPDATR
jgi:hypothetical protein